METTVKKKRTYPGPSERIRNLEPGETITFPIEQYSSVRSIACNTGKMFGTFFKTKRIDEYTVTVTRTKTDYFTNK